jgi:hypothetical protein
VKRTTVLHASSLALTGVFVLFALGSGKPKTDASEGGTTVTTPSAAPAKPAPPKEIDRAALDKELACAGSKSEACRIWTDFTAATAAPALPASGMAVYVGKSFATGGPKPGYVEFVYLQIVGENTAAPPGISDSDVLAANLSLRTYDAADNTGDAEALLAALKTAKKPPSFNLFAMQTEVKVYSQSPDAVVRTAGVSTGFADKGGVVGWMRKKDNRLLVVEYAGAGTTDHETRGGLSTNSRTTAAKVWCTEAWLLKEK